MNRRKKKFFLRIQVASRKTDASFLTFGLTTMDLKEKFADYKAMVDADIEKGKRASSKEKSYKVTIFHKEGSQVVEGESKSFDLLQAADGWADRKLFADASALHAEIVTSLIRKNGSLIKFTVMRQDAIARMLRAKRGPTMKSNTVGGNGSLSFKPRVKNDTFYFSHG